MTSSPSTRRRIATLVGALASPLIAAGLLIGWAPTAGAQPSSDAQCSSMTMPTGQAGANPNALTRAGQVGSAAGGGTPASSSMPVDCSPASHG